jgi:peptidoglycan/xylan/chitin deacetylase (PgdA/CDA1 family)
MDGPCATGICSEAVGGCTIRPRDVEDCEPDIVVPRAGVVLSFDDDFVDQWFAHRDLLDRYGAKATFFVTRFDLLSDDAVEKLRTLQSEGHEIGCHGLTHVSPKVYAEEHGVQGYIDAEVVPALKLMSEAGLSVGSFSYPWGGRSNTLDTELGRYFRILRTSGSVTDLDRVIHDWGHDKVVGAGRIDHGHVTSDEIDAAMARTAATGGALVLYTHRILPESDQSHIRPENLEAVLKAAVDHGLEFLTISDLAPDPVDIPVCEGGPEIIYGFLDEGSIDHANAMLEDIWYTETRYESVALPWPLTWTEDPLGENYWRFIFYSLRPTAHLLYAYRTTGDVRYLNKLLAVLRSFADSGESSPHTRDKHTQAFLAMVLVNSYVKLQCLGVLPSDLAEVLRGVIYRRGLYLEEPAHFEVNNNHGVTQAAALLLVAHNFPDFDKSGGWRELAIERLEKVVGKNVAADGVQIEQSPFYHFYVLNFFWQIFHWDLEAGAWGDESFYDTIEGMFRFAIHVTQPDGWIPVIGSSKFYEVKRKALQGEMAEYDPVFRYVFTLGREGDKPSETSVLFPESGWAILRSAFNPAETYDQATQLIFDVGPYRTGHSHLDALGVHLYARGRAVLTDSGLYSYEEGPKHDYFFGTRAHNTVVVDGGDQAKGTATAGTFLARDGWSYQSGYHDLYAGVRHRRAVALLGEDLTVVLDRVEPRGGSASHRIEQMWHLFPEAEIEVDGLTVAARVPGAPSPSVVIRQLLPDGCDLQTVKGQADPYRGWYSWEYEVDVQSWELSYGLDGSSGDYATVIATGHLADSEFTATVHDDDGCRVVTVQGPAGAPITLKVCDLAGQGETVTASIPSE